MSALDAIISIAKNLGWTSPETRTESGNSLTIAQLEEAVESAFRGGDEALKRHREEAKKKPKPRAPARRHWFKCHRCGQNIARRVAAVPKQRCKICKDEAMAYDYMGYMANPYQKAESVDEPKRTRQIVMDNQQEQEQ